MKDLVFVCMNDSGLWVELVVDNGSMWLWWSRFWKSKLWRWWHNQNCAWHGKPLLKLNPPWPCCYAMLCYGHNFKNSSLHHFVELSEVKWQKPESWIWIGFNFIRAIYMLSSKWCDVDAVSYELWQTEERTVVIFIFTFFIF